MKKKILISLIPLGAALLFALLTLIPAYRQLENRIFDLYLRVNPPPEEHEEILLLNIDDLAISQVGMFPWSRDIMADGLILMKEFGAKYALFDIEYTENSAMGVNGEVLRDKVPQAFAREFNSLKGNTLALFQAIQAGQIPLAEAESYIQDLGGITEEAEEKLLAEVSHIARDNDDYFGRAARFFEHAFYTVNMQTEANPDIDETYKQWVHDNVSLGSVTTVKEPRPITAESVDIRPAIGPILKRAAGAGFPNVVLDPDGVRRRLHLVQKNDGYYYGQLAFRPLLDWLGNPPLRISDSQMYLEGAVLPDGTKKNITIPLEKGTMLLNWPKKDFDDSYRHLSYYYLVLHQEQEKRLVDNLKIMEKAGYLRYHTGKLNLMSAHDQLERMRSSLLEASPQEFDAQKGLLEDYTAGRKLFFDEAGNFLTGEAEPTLVGRIDSLLGREDLPEANRAEYTSIRADVVKSFGTTREIYENLKKTRDILRENMEGSFCITGWTGTGTTDRGVNPFDGTYDNVGTHATVVNTILGGRFFNILPVGLSFLLAAAGGLFIGFVQYRRTGFASIIAGAILLVALIVLNAALFIATGLYIPLQTPLFAGILALVTLTMINFLSTAREKTFIRGAFGQYLSNSVIDDLLENPDKLQLGGEKKRLTAMFTDVKGFSTISEQMDPTDLVTLLNIYLTEMSDTILDLHGTIDKFEGDAIIAFFGAPIEFSDHAYRTCLAAVRMHKVEQALNKRIVEEGLSPSTLHTRIGINTGEIVVGNMGTSKKMDYTMMGNAVNLAARLEGVNKKYGTWLLMSDSTFEDCGGHFLTRKLDQVRVVGIYKPVRLYELIDEKKNAPPEVSQKVDSFEEGLEAFEHQEWSQARKTFERLLKDFPDDAPTALYLKRCQEFEKTPPDKNWEGVYKLTEK